MHFKIIHFIYQLMYLKFKLMKVLLLKVLFFIDLYLK
jgi:hypothetical protein